MKDMVATAVVSAGKWIVIGLIVAAVGLMLLFGLGRKRGTRLYRWRVAMWAFAVALSTGGALVTFGCSSAGQKMPLAEDTVADVKDDADGAAKIDEWVYESCYVFDPGPDLDANAQPDEAYPTCYITDPGPDLDANAQPDEAYETCYLPALDAGPDLDASAQPDDGAYVECYLPIDIPDAVEVTSPEVQPDTADTSTEQDVFMECYNGVAMDAKYPPK